MLNLVGPGEACHGAHNYFVFFLYNKYLEILLQNIYCLFIDNLDTLINIYTFFTCFIVFIMKKPSKGLTSASRNFTREGLKRKL